MKSKNIIIVVIAAVLLSALSASILFSPDKTPPTSEIAVAKLLKRIDQLERLVNQEQAERIKLQNLVNLSRSLDPADQQSIEVDTVTESDTENSVAQQAQTDPSFGFEDLRAQRRTQAQLSRKKRRLISAGFIEDEANWLIQNEAEIQLQVLYQEHEVQRQALKNAATSAPTNVSEKFRKKIGDDYYERYLKANNQSTSVNVASILGSSPGQNAGLQAGDNITRYAGKRIFNVLDLNKLTVQGEAGESVLLEIERNGTPLQLTIPRGPVGINASRRR